MKDIFGTATRRKWRWDYIPAITITYLRSVRLLDSIMLYLMGGTASRVWHDIRGRVNIYPVRFLKCPDLQWPLCCPPHIYCRALPTAIQIHFCLAPRVTSFPLPAPKNSLVRAFRVYVFEEGLTIEREIIDRMKSNELNASSYSSSKSDNWYCRLYHLNHLDD